MRKYFNKLGWILSYTHTYTKLHTATHLVTIYVSISREYLLIIDYIDLFCIV